MLARYRKQIQVLRRKVLMKTENFPKIQCIKCPLAPFDWLKPSTNGAAITQTTKGAEKPAIVSVITPRGECENYVMSYQQIQ